MEEMCPIPPDLGRQVQRARTVMDRKRIDEETDQQYHIRVFSRLTH